MTSHRLWRSATTGLLVSVACAALAWGDCMMLATSVVLAHRLLRLHLDQAASPSWRALTAAVNALSAGLLMGGAGVALMLGIVAGWWGWWHPEADHPAAVLLMLALGAACCCAARRDRQQAWAELRVWAWLLGGVLLTIEAQRMGVMIAPCLLAMAIGLAILRAGWSLSSQTASALLRSETGSR